MTPAIAQLSDPCKYVCNALRTARALHTISANRRVRNVQQTASAGWRELFSELFACLLRNVCRACRNGGLECNRVSLKIVSSSEAEMNGCTEGVF